MAMEKPQTAYETLFIIDSTLSEDAIKALVEKFTSLISANGTLSAVNEWGRRRLAYPIDFKTEGYYVLVNFTAPAEFPGELDRIFNITDGIIRGMIVKTPT